MYIVFRWNNSGSGISSDSDQCPPQRNTIHLKHSIMHSTRSRFGYPLLFLLVGICLAGSTYNHSIPSKKYFQIERNSKLYLKGTSNVNAFTCHCEDQYDAQVIEAEINGGYARFKDAGLKLSSKNFNCHNRKIDNDMQKALQSDRYPAIKITLVDTWQDAKHLQGSSKEWFDVRANVTITITNVTKKECIPVKARQTGPNQFQVQGEKALQMSVFGVDPPEAMFGMIKVDDWITFHFDLVVSVSEAL